jgi:coenzyme F420-0:L-glutamate ligase/coenzyme F420-1:gamma-L-glutamate ligase
LEVTEVALADALAAAAGLVLGEAAEGTPAVLVRGFSCPAPANPASALIRPLAEDLFR